MCKLLLSCFMLAWMVSMAYAQLDVAKLAKAYKDFDTARNEGKGFSENPDSSTLGWGEGSIIQSYALMWEATGDTYWLGQISRHFRNMMATATDPDGDGYLSWQTAVYNCNVAYAQRLHNVSAAEIAPDHIKQWAKRGVPNATGHTYLIEFQADAAHFQIRDWDTQELVAGNVEYVDGADIEQIGPFKFKITGAAHQGDRFMVRTQPPEPTEFTVHQGMFIYPVARFIEAVKSNPDLQDEFGKDADEFLAFINKHLFEKNEQDWLEMGELGGGYRFQPLLTDRFANRIMPHNQFAALARAWVVLKDIEGAHPLMADRAEKMVRYFHSFLELDEDNNAYKWRYWDWIEYGEPGSMGSAEDTSHAALTMSLAVVAARRGLIFTDEDMVRIANTWLKLMWNQDEQEPLMAASVAGGEPHKAPALYNWWSDLSQWDRQVYDLALTCFLAADEQKQAAWAPAMLHCAKRAGVQLK